MKIVMITFLLSLGTAYAGTCKIKVKPTFFCTQNAGPSATIPCGFALNSWKKVKLETTLDGCVAKAKELQEKYKDTPDTMGMKTRFTFKDQNLSIKGKVR